MSETWSRGASAALARVPRHCWPGWCGAGTSRTRSLETCARSLREGLRKAAPTFVVTRVGGLFSQELVMDNCDEVPAEAWAELRAAEWPELRKASFEWRLGLLGEGEGGSEAEG